MNVKNLIRISLILFWFETQIMIIASKRFEIVGRNKIPNKTPYSTVDVKFEQHCFSKCHHMTKCLSFLINRTSNAMPIRCHFYDSISTNLTDIQITTADTKLFTTADIQDCQDLYNSGYKDSGVYYINFLGKGQRDIRCDMEIEGGGWIVILYRMTGQHNWNVGWNQYKNGIGEMTSDFYLGNELIHQITDSGQYQMYFTTELRAVDSPPADPMYYGWYEHFHVADEADSYRLSIGGFKGGQTDLLTHLDGTQFTTIDRDRDTNNNKNCGNVKKGGFWWRACGGFQPTSIYLDTNSMRCMGLYTTAGRTCTKNFQIMIKKKI
ncbi:angiopoietin-related protein 7-like [Clytia hemisphaerica]|uniref:Fibrinogen C-terminal domain-containing protein n=1 Tax=Clytia hemisphaerica TaxID=252671 RepID=A0A7M5XF51_9CNID